MGTRLIALDLDGTLLNEKMHVSEKTRQVMELCAQRGIEIVPATGRNPISSKGGWGEWVELVTGQSIASQTVYAATYAKWGYNIGIGQKGLRNTILNPTEYTPNQNGEICWQYE